MPQQPTVDAIILGSDGGPPDLRMEISGEPVSQGRARARTCGRDAKKRIVVYDPNKKYKDGLKRSVRRALTDLGWYDFPFFGNENVEMTIEFKIVQDNKDLDNMEKLILDVLSKIVYKDDKKVKSIHVKKEKTDEGSTKLYIKKLD